MDDESANVSIHPDQLDEINDASFCSSLDEDVDEGYSIFFLLKSQKVEGLEISTSLTF